MDTLEAHSARTEEAAVVPSASSSCPTCSGAAGPAGAPPSRVAAPYIYAIGKIEARFPRLSVEKEFAQAVARESHTAKLTDRQTLHAVLSKPENSYLVRQLCWVMTIEGLETYIVVPRVAGDTTLLVGALCHDPTPLDLDVVVGVRGPVATPDMCNGLMVPVVVFDQIYSFDRDSLIKAIPRPEKTSAKEFEAAAEELFGRVMQMADNAGSTDDHRALNYLSVRYPAIYELAAAQFAANASLSGVSTRLSTLSGTRKLVNVIFSYTNRSTDVVEKFFTSVDVTDEFPFLVTKLTPTYDRP
jgi:hypothetical protein